VSECDREALIMRRPWRAGISCTMEKYKYSESLFLVSVTQHVMCMHLITFSSVVCQFLQNLSTHTYVLIIVQQDATKTVYFLFSKFTLHISGVNHAHHQEYIKL